MRVLVVYCHPSHDSVTHRLCESFIEGLRSAGIEYELSDLYAMDFRTDMSESEYLREGYYDDSQPIPEDIIAEHEKIERADGIAFIYPVFWTEAPAKLVGWFQRVWTYGYAYGLERCMKRLEKALMLVCMGGDKDDPVRVRQIAAMREVMLGDRIYDRAQEKDMVIFDRMTRGYGNDEYRREKSAEFAEQAFLLGKNFFEK